MSTVEMTVLGKSPAMPDRNGAHSGYLIREAGYSLLLDCGGGVFSKLRAFADPAEVNAVLISHLHADHLLDLLPFSFALSRSQNGSTPRRPPLWGPPGSREVFSTFAGVLGMEDQINESFAVSEYDPTAELQLGPLAVSFSEVPHYIRSWACDLRSEEGRRLTFGADCGPNDAIVELARDTDVLMTEATDGAGPHQGRGFRGHMTASEAGELARRAGAARLVLTHYSDELDSETLRSAAESSFGGPVELAVERAQYII